MLSQLNLYQVNLDLLFHDYNCDWKQSAIKFTISLIERQLKLKLNLNNVIIIQYKNENGLPYYTFTLPLNFKW